uniref:Uncharacterized protein n=1 Tax=Arundo donax TaxID=35708 RepID=A0A0A9C6R5_ARUDO
MTIFWLFSTNKNSKKFSTFSVLCVLYSSAHFRINLCPCFS